MIRTLVTLLTVTLLLPPLHAKDNHDSEKDRSGSRTPTSSLPVNMGNPNKPTWQAEFRGN